MGAFAKDLGIFAAILLVVWYFFLRQTATAQPQGVYNTVYMPNGPWPRNGRRPIYDGPQWPIMRDSGNRQGPYRVGPAR